MLPGRTAFRIMRISQYLHNTMIVCYMIAQHRREPAGTLSGGTRQKLNLTLALLHDPDVLLLDEPYQGFDWETYLRFWDLVADLRAHRKAIVIITHLVFDQDHFDLLADLSGGRLTRRMPPGKDSHAR
jgi:ABC-2 type transport system ATP-binding protein